MNFEEMTMRSTLQLKVADEVWIATAQLHKNHPRAIDFSVDEIVEQAASISSEEPLRPGVYVHAIQHCVANRAPNPGRYRMLFETGEGRRRLFRKGDPAHPDRADSKVVPERGDLPSEFHELLTWYEDWSQQNAETSTANDPLIRLQGSGQQLWADEPADAYVERLREGWQ
jgi:hypothetical protein